MSNFIEIKPAITRGVYTGDKVKIIFPKKTKETGSQTLIVYFGKDVAKRLGVRHGDRVRLFVDEFNPSIWLLKKGEEQLGYKVMDIKHHQKGENKTFKFQLVWKREVPEACKNHTSKFINFDFYEGGIRLFLPGTTYEDRLL